MPHVNKKTTSDKENFGLNKKLRLERTMNGLGKPFRKNPIQETEKTVKRKLKLLHVNEKSLARKRIFVLTLFSHSTSKIRVKTFHAAKPLAFSLHCLFRRDQNHFSNMTSKIMKMVEHILKNNANTIKIL